MSPWERSLQEVCGYLELGMIAEAKAVWEKMDLEDRRRMEAIQLRVNLHMAEKEWAAGRELALHLVSLQPEDAGAWISLAYCTRRAQSVEEAEAILERAVALHPTEAMVRYNLACYACVTGRLEKAREWLREAMALHDHVRILAVEDEDLKPLWRELNESN